MCIHFPQVVFSVHLNGAVQWGCKRRGLWQENVSICQNTKQSNKAQHRPPLHPHREALWCCHTVWSHGKEKDKCRNALLLLTVRTFHGFSTYVFDSPPWGCVTKAVILYFNLIHCLYVNLTKKFFLSFCLVT